jgi:hypothetical protein
VSRQQRANYDVSILVKRNLKKYITHWQNIDENIIKSNIYLIQQTLTVIGIYAPLDNELVTARKNFFMKLHNYRADNREFLLLNFNSKTGGGIKMK